MKDLFPKNTQQIFIQRETNSQTFPATRTTQGIDPEWGQLLPYILTPTCLPTIVAVCCYNRSKYNTGINVEIIAVFSEGEALVPASVLWYLAV